MAAIQAMADLQEVENSHIDGMTPKETEAKAQQVYNTLKGTAEKGGAARALLVLIGQEFRKKMEDPSKSLEMVNEHRSKMESGGDRVGVAVMKLAQAEIQAETKKFAERQEALELALEAKAEFKDLDQKWLELRALNCACGVHIKKCNHLEGPKAAREATKIAREAMGLATKLKDKRQEAMALYLLFTAKMYCEVHFKDGIRYARRAADLFGEVGSVWWKGTVLRTISDWAQMKGEGAEGKIFAEEALETFRQMEEGSVGREGGEASALASLVGTHSFQKDGGEAAVEVALLGAEKLKNGSKRSEAQALCVMARAHLLNDDTIEALLSAEEALSIYAELGDKNAQAQTLSEIGEIHGQAGDFDDALSAYHDASEISKEIGDIRFQVYAMSAIVRMQLSKNEFEEGLAAGEEALEVCKLAGDQETKGVIMLNLASAHSAKEDYDSALSLAEEARELFVDLDNKDREAQSYVILTDINKRSGSIEEGLKFAVKAKELYHKTANRLAEAATLHTISELRMMQAEKAGEPQDEAAGNALRKLYKTAMKESKEGLAIARHLGTKDPRGALQANLCCTVATVCGIMGMYREALKHADEAKGICQQSGDTGGLVGVLLVAAQVHRYNDNLKEGKAIAERALSLAQQIGDESLENTATKVIEQMEPKKAPEPVMQQVMMPGAAPGQQQAVVFAESVAVADAGAGGALKPYDGPSAEELMPSVNSIVMQMITIDELHNDVPLMEAGIDSLASVSLRNALQTEFKGVAMTSSSMFNYPTVRQLSEYIAEEFESAYNAGEKLY